MYFNKNITLSKGDVTERRYLARAKLEPYVPLREVRARAIPVDRVFCFIQLYLEGLSPVILR